MRLRYGINVTLDGCVDHLGITPSQDVHEHATASLARADALLFGRTTYELMEGAWRPPLPDDAPDWAREFVAAIGPVRKYVVSSTLPAADWNAELIRGDVLDAVRALKDGPDGDLYVGGVTLPTALARAGLIDEYEFLVLPHVAGRGPRLLDGVVLDLELVETRAYPSGAVLTRYRA